MLEPGVGTLTHPKVAGYLAGHWLVRAGENFLIAYPGATLRPGAYGTQGKHATARKSQS